MCPVIEKICKKCHKTLSHNNKIGFCINCLPEGEIISLFKEGKTIQSISKEIFNSISGNYRGFIRKTLIKHYESDFLQKRKSNKSKEILKKNYNKLPLDFIKEMHNDGKLTTQIHKALIQKGYKLHLVTVRHILKYLNLKITGNWLDWKNGH